MGYNSKLEQTNRRVAKAKRKYYGSFDYGSGIRVKSKGGNLQLFPHTEPFNSFDAGGWVKGLSAGAGIASSAYNLAKPTTSYDDWRNGVLYQQRGFDNMLSGITDNSSLLSAYDAFGEYSAPTKNTFDNRNDFEKFLGVASMATAGAAAGHSIAPGIGTAIGAGVGILGGAIGLGVNSYLNDKYTKQGTALTNSLNVSNATKLAKTATLVDTMNDRKRKRAFMDTVDYAFGGPMSHGEDFNNGLTFINAGGSHETNPNEGVPVGVDSEGIPNLVEEGEVIWNNDYVFSDRTKIPEELANKYNLGGDLSFADAIKEVTKESEMRPNDPISNITNKAIVEEFMEAQEGLRKKEQIQAAREYNDALDAQFMDQLALATQGIPQEQEMAMPAPQGYQQEPYPMQDESMMPPGYAKGGHLFQDGGEKLRIYKEYKEAFKKDKGLSVDPEEDDVYRSEFYKYMREKDPNYYYRNFYGSLDDDYDETGTHLKELPESYQRSQYVDDLMNNSGAFTDFIDPAILTEDKIERKKPLDVAGPTVKLSEFNTGVDPSLLKSPVDNEYLDKLTADQLAELMAGLPQSEKTEQKIVEENRNNWERDAAIWAPGLAALYGLTGSPDYSNVNPLFARAEALGAPVSIPVETIGDYVQTRPFDERYLVNQATQARNAAYRGAMGTSGGNRAMQLGAQSYLAGAYQNNLAEIMRQAYLANRQDAMTAAEFNRGTNLQNMSAINARNTAQAQLNSQRQQAGYSALASAYGMKQGIKDTWDAATERSLNTFIQNLGNKGRENEELDRFMSLIKEGYVLDYDPKSNKYFFSAKEENKEKEKETPAATVPTYAQPTPIISNRAAEPYWAARGGKLKKKRRF